MIYIIYKNDDPNFYLGQTKNIKNRMYLHKYDCKTKQHLKLYNYINNNGGWDQWKYKIISYDNLETENVWYNILKPTLNTNVCGRDFKGWYYANKEYFKNWRSKNPTYMRDYMREYNKKKKDTI